jgi:hypothetical protein
MTKKVKTVSICIFFLLSTLPSISFAQDNGTNFSNTQEPTATSGEVEAENIVESVLMEQVEESAGKWWDEIGQIATIISGVWATINMIPPCLPNTKLIPIVPVISYNLNNLKAMANAILTLVDYTQQAERLERLKETEEQLQREGDIQDQIQTHQRHFDEIEKQYEFVERIAVRDKIWEIVSDTVASFAILEVIFKYLMIADWAATVVGEVQAALWTAEGMTCEKAGSIAKDALGITAATAWLSNFAKSIWEAIKGCFIDTAAKKSGENLLKRFGAEIRLALSIAEAYFAIKTALNSRERSDAVKERLNLYDGLLDDLKSKVNTSTFNINLINNANAQTNSGQPTEIVTAQMNSCYYMSSNNMPARDKKGTQVPISRDRLPFVKILLGLS